MLYIFLVQIEFKLHNIKQVILRYNLQMTYKYTTFLFKKVNNDLPHQNWLFNYQFLVRLLINPSLKRCRIMFEDTKMKLRFQTYIVFGQHYTLPFYLLWYIYYSTCIATSQRVIRTLLPSKKGRDSFSETDQF